MQIVRARARGDVDDRTGVAAVFGAEVARADRELLHRVQRDRLADLGRRFSLCDNPTDPLRDPDRNRRHDDHDESDRVDDREVLSLPGMKRILSEARPLLLMELHGQDSSRAAWEALTAAGYRICWMRKGYPRIGSLEEMDWKAYIVAFPPGGS